ncbi:MAG: ROK family protein [Sciscionella sp.]
MNEPVLALDIGGTKITAGLVGHAGRVLHRYRRDIPHSDAEATWAAVREAVDTARGNVTVAGVGVGCAGPIDVRTGKASPINLPCWRDFPLLERISALLPALPVAMAGDGVCMTMGEHLAGAGRGSENLLGVVVSTGIGGGLVLRGEPYLGRTGNAGHIGHMVTEPDGLPCTCGGRGCVETVASGPAMVRWARVSGWQAPESAHAEHLAAAALMGDEIAQSAFSRAGKAVGRAIAGVAAVCDLDLVVVGGGVARSGPLLFEPLRTTLAAHSRLSYLDGLAVVPTALDEDAALLGAASLIRTREHIRVP